MLLGDTRPWRMVPVDHLSNADRGLALRNDWATLPKLIGIANYLVLKRP